VEHLEENGKPCLYLVFEYLSTDLKKFMDRNGKGPAHPLPPELVKVRAGLSHSCWQAEIAGLGGQCRATWDASAEGCCVWCRTAAQIMSQVVAGGAPPLQLRQPVPVTSCR